MARGSFLTEVEIAQLQRGLNMALESVCYNMASALGSRSVRNPWAVKDQVWIIHELGEMLANHLISAAECGELMEGLRLPDKNAIAE